MRTLFVLITLIFMISCGDCANTDIDIAESTETITQEITDTRGKTLYLVKMNPTASIVSKNKSGHVKSDVSINETDESIDIFDENIIDETDENISDTFNETGATFIKPDNPLAFTFYPKNAGTSRSARAFDDTEYNIGDTKNFWILEDSNAMLPKWKQLSAKLRAKSVYCNIWVPDEYWNLGENSVSEAIVNKLSEKFDLIYPRVTNVFGAPYESQVKINILIFDLDDDYTSGTIFGYFMSKDYSEYDETYRSNECCMFYLDAYHTRKDTEMAYSTLAHEFQHMINFYNKIFRNSANPEDDYTWFTEMLSMLCEDMLLDFLEIDVKDSPIQRIALFNNGYYRHGITEWQGNQYSYACIYAFGAYLVRNFGGVKLLSAIGKNEFINMESITAALQELGYDETFDSVFLKFAEALIYEDSDKLTFNKGFTERFGDYDYKFKAFNIWEITNGQHSLNIEKNYGPLCFSPTALHQVRPYGFTIHTQESWKNITTDSLTVKFTKPKNSNMEFRFILK